MARGKRNYTVPLIVIATICVVLFANVITMGGITPPQDVNDYGTVYLRISPDDGTYLSALDTIPDGKQLSVRWEADIKASDMVAKLYSVAGNYLQTGNYLRIGDYMHNWGFTLASVPTGLTEVYVQFSGTYTPDILWGGQSFHFYVENGQAPVFPPATFTEEQVDTTGTSTTLTQLRWYLISEGPATATVKIDGVLESERSLTGSNYPQVFTFSHTYEVGTYIVTLIITPLYGDEISTSCEVEITAGTTTGTTTTTTTTTTTEPPPPDEPDYTIVIMAVGGAIVVVLVLTRRK